MNEPCFYRVSVKALITDDAGKFLLAKESNGTWDMLGGGLDHNEDPIVALRREIEEETGLKVNAVSSTPRYFLTAYKSEKDMYLANVIYEVTIKDLDFTPSDECVELDYFTVETAEQLSVLPNIKQFLKLLAQ